MPSTMRIRMRAPAGTVTPGTVAGATAAVGAGAAGSAGGGAGTMSVSEPEVIRTGGAGGGFGSRVTLTTSFMLYDRTVPFTSIWMASAVPPMYLPLMTRPSFKVSVSADAATASVRAAQTASARTHNVFAFMASPHPGHGNALVRASLRARQLPSITDAP